MKLSFIMSGVISLDLANAVRILLDMFILGFSHILVIGGNQKQTEVIDLTDFSLTCTSAFGELDSIRKHAVGELINGTPIVCGGEDISDCIVFGSTQNERINLIEIRHRSASVLLNDTHLWILGGKSSSGNYNSTEMINLNADNSVSGPELPVNLDSACAVKFNDSHIYLTGGYYSMDDIGADKVWIYNMFDSSWTKGPSMKGARSVHGCTVFDQSLVIVAGGWNDGTALSSVEILDPNMNQWVPGEN